MGIPKFFRWASQRYPAILSKVLSSEDEPCPPVDNLYLDMNGIIHQCSHGNDNQLHSTSEIDAIIAKVAAEVDRLVSVVTKPQALLYIAVDGVAPRAKLNQQRSRRFRAAAELQKKIEAEGKVGESYFDSNCITPGTEFMERVTVGLQKHIQDCFSNRPAWRNLRVIFSGSDVPGEGEHKIISYIRDQRACNGNSPNTRHCVYGADADMMVLSVATHEPFVIVLRETVVYSKPQRNGHSSATNSSASDNTTISPKPMQFIRVHALREYLYRELSEGSEEGELDKERLLDDFVFLTYFVGNDFLPILPGLSIGDDAFDILFDAYKTMLNSESGGYLVDNEGNIDCQNLQTVVTLVGHAERVVYQQNEIAKMFKQQRSEKRSSNRHSHGGNGHSNSSNHHASRADEQAGEGASSPADLDLRKGYYYSKLGFSVDTEEGQAELRTMSTHYLQGLIWCWNYYHRGCVSWSYYYPYHYGLFLEDFTDLEDIGRTIHFDLSAPVTPFQQLLACLPPASASLLPACYRPLMTSPDSPLIHYYPRELVVDMNGMKRDWEAIVLLPFLDFNQVLTIEHNQCPSSSLTSAEQRRNVFGDIHTYQFEHDGTVSESVKKFSAAPGERFHPVLPAGSAHALPRYPKLDNLLSSHTFGKAGYSLNELRIGNKGSNMKSSRGQERTRHAETFVMPGVVSAPTLRFNDAPHLLASPYQLPYVSNYSHGLQLCLALDDNTDNFLSTLAVSIQQQVPSFFPHEHSPELGHVLSANIQDLCDHFYHTIPSSSDINNMVHKLGEIFGAVRFALLPTAVLIRDQEVGILIEDRSHLGQMDQFLLQRIIGEQAFQR
jgi:5'-3' exoribonuclease 1